MSALRSGRLQSRWTLHTCADGIIETVRTVSSNLHQHPLCVLATAAFVEHAKGHHWSCSRVPVDLVPLPSAPLLLYPQIRLLQLTHPQLVPLQHLLLSGRHVAVIHWSGCANHVVKVLNRQTPCTCEPGVGALDIHTAWAGLVLVRVRATKVSSAEEVQIALVQRSWSTKSNATPTRFPQ
jgi:hypothetical protein